MVQNVCTCEQEGLIVGITFIIWDRIHECFVNAILFLVGLWLAIGDGLAVTSWFCRVSSQVGYHAF